MIENITHKKEILAIIIRRNYLKKKGINFFTNPKLNQQVAFMNHPKNHLIQPHSHKKRFRKIRGSTEVLIILDWILKINFFDNNNKLILSKTIKKNYIVILLKGCHGFEVKQGPYLEAEDKSKF